MILDWHVDKDTWHCSTESGITAYIDPSPTASSAVRVVGPWVPTGSPRVSHENSALSLIRKIETDLFVGCYVVFGVYQDHHCERNCPFTLNGDIYGFVPSIGIRTAMTSGDSVLRSPEWDGDPRYLQHRSGLRFDRNSECVENPDGAVLHPATLAADIATLGRSMQVAPDLVEQATRCTYEYLATRFKHFQQTSIFQTKRMT